MDNSSEFFSNTACKYFPCHEGLKDFNCMFCYCPMYTYRKCLGNPKFIEKNGKEIKVCSDCTFPHRPENYQLIMTFLTDKLKEQAE